MEALGWAGVASLLVAYLLPGRAFWAGSYVACILLAFYAGMRGDEVFLVLNLVLAIISTYRAAGFDG